MISRNLVPSPPPPSSTLLAHRRSSLQAPLGFKPAKKYPARPVSAEALAKLGVLSWVVPMLPLPSTRRNRDVINVSREGMGAVYEEKIRGYFEEHMHEDEEIRYILSGSGLFDVRGDLLVLPAGIYHRFTLDTKDAIRALRLFKTHARRRGDPVYFEWEWVFDVRETPTDAWIRIAVAPGDLLVLPVGIYHRFTLDTKDQIRAL
ncbi:1,2-dihydroxy-3-keto-5-methylthiopentene dioxygenase [Mycena sanguinolenta]|uniref:acireductone dioxygenase (Fe(2+)-requiring) n=1 Tax=Mycena sanguinolenta TaxID=230812 RepID=A0A8H6Y6X4_9AGAR|nr:1,2-dihydroxy-3-keto-5-methylthiopentene dioxygenase [Mycena sanguinolenta]